MQPIAGTSDEQRQQHVPKKSTINCLTEILPRNFHRASVSSFRFAIRNQTRRSASAEISQGVVTADSIKTFASNCQYLYYNFYRAGWAACAI